VTRLVDIAIMDVLGEVATAHRCGMLVPFVGSGLSLPVCRDWEGMIGQLEVRAGTVPGQEVRAGTVPGRTGTHQARRAAHALDRLRLGQGLTTSGIVAEVLLERGPAAPPEATRALADLRWPLVLTTNYDDLYVAAAHQVTLRSARLTRDPTEEAERKRPAVRVAGRSSVDCHRVLSSLLYPGTPLLWAMQGFLGGQATITPPEAEPLPYQDWATPGHDPAELAAQVVVGHAEYRRAAMRSESFRRAFAEVFRSRSLLFLGSGVSDPYLLDLFSQVVELYGPSPRPHFVVSKRGELDGAFLRRQFGIWVHEIDDHGELPALIRGIGTAAGRSPRPMRIALRGLPERPSDQSCVMISGGGSRAVPRVRPELASYTGVVATEFEPDGRRTFIWRRRKERSGPLTVIARARLNPRLPKGIELRPVAPGARVSTDDRGRAWRDIRLIAPAVRETLEVAAEAGKTVLLATLLASGELRTISPSYVLIETIRAWAGSPFRERVALTIHVVNEEARDDLTAGRIDVERLMAGGPLRFWVECRDPDGVTSRFLALEPAGRAIADVLREAGIEGDTWSVDVEPPPCLEWTPWQLSEIARAEGPPMTLERFGVLAGSTLRVTRPEARATTAPAGHGEP
jgi:hypothetical protein